MNLRRKIKASIFAVCLGLTIVGFSAYAMDETERNKIIDMEEKVGRSEDYANYYAKLKLEDKLDEDKARLQAGVYIKALIEYKEAEYVNYYMKLRIEEKIEKDKVEEMLKIYIKERKEDRSCEYADYFAKLIVLESMVDDIKTRERVDLYLKKMEMSEVKSIESIECADCYARLKTEFGYKEEFSDEFIKIYNRLLKEGKNKYYAFQCSMLILETGLCEEDAKHKTDIMLSGLDEFHQNEEIKKMSILETEEGKYKIFKRTVEEKLSQRRNMPYTKYYAKVMSNLYEKESKMIKDSQNSRVNCKKYETKYWEKLMCEIKEYIAMVQTRKYVSLLGGLDFKEADYCAASTTQKECEMKLRKLNLEIDNMAKIMVIGDESIDKEGYKRFIKDFVYGYYEDYYSIVFKENFDKEPEYKRYRIGK